MLGKTKLEEKEVSKLKRFQARQLAEMPKNILLMKDTA